MKIIIQKDMVAMPVMDMSTPEHVRQNLRRDLKEIYTPEEMEAIHRAIRYTQLHKQEEARAKMDEESPLISPMPVLTKKELRDLGTR